MLAILNLICVVLVFLFPKPLKIVVFAVQVLCPDELPCIDEVVSLVILLNAFFRVSEDATAKEKVQHVKNYAKEKKEHGVTTEDVVEAAELMKRAKKLTGKPNGFTKEDKKRDADAAMEAQRYYTKSSMIKKARTNKGSKQSTAVTNSTDTRKINQF